MSNQPPRRVHIAPGARLVAQGKMSAVRTPDGASLEAKKTELFFIYTHLIDQITRGIELDDVPFNENPLTVADPKKKAHLDDLLFDAMCSRHLRRAVVRAADLLDAITPEDQKRKRPSKADVRPKKGWRRFTYFCESKMRTPHSAVHRILSEFNGIRLLRMFYERTVEAVRDRVRSEVPDIGRAELRQIARNSVGLVLMPANGHVNQLFEFLGVGRRDRRSGINTMASGHTLEPDLKEYKFDRIGRVVRYQQNPLKYPIAGNGVTHLPPGGVISDLSSAGDPRGIDLALGCPARIAIDPSRPSFLVRLWYQAVDSVLDREHITRLPAPDLSPSTVQSFERPPATPRLRPAAPDRSL